MEKKTYRKTYRCVVDVTVECDGWSEELTNRFAPSVEGVGHAL